MDQIMMFAEAETISELINSRNLIPIVAITLGCTVGIVAVVFSSLTGLAKARAKENSRREIAAYIAEGSLTPEQGVALMEAGKSSDGCSLS